MPRAHLLLAVSRGIRQTGPGRQQGKRHVVDGGNLRRSAGAKQHLAHLARGFPRAPLRQRRLCPNPINPCALPGALPSPSPAPAHRTPALLLGCISPPRTPALSAGIFSTDHGIRREDISSQIMGARRKWLERGSGAVALGGNGGGKELACGGGGSQVRHTPNEGDYSEVVSACETVEDALRRCCEEVAVGRRDTARVSNADGKEGGGGGGGESGLRASSAALVRRLRLPDGVCLLSGDATTRTNVRTGTGLGGQGGEVGAGEVLGEGMVEGDGRTGLGGSVVHGGGGGGGRGGEGGRLRVPLLSRCEAVDERGAGARVSGAGGGAVQTRGEWELRVEGSSGERGGHREGSEVRGQWHLDIAAQGCFQFVNAVWRVVLEEADSICAPHVPNAAITVEGGPWTLQGSSVRCAGGMAVRARRLAQVSLRCCFVGGLGPLADRAVDGIVARGNASLNISDSSVGACLFAALRAHEDTVVRVWNSSISHCGLALGFYGNCLIGFHGSSAGNLSCLGALHTEPHFTRTARAELFDSTFSVPRLWCPDGAPEYGFTKVPIVRRCLQRRVRLVYPRALASGWLRAGTRNSSGGKLPQHQAKSTRGTGAGDVGARDGEVHLDHSNQARALVGNASQISRAAAAFVAEAGGGNARPAAGSGQASEVGRARGDSPARAPASSSGEVSRGEVREADSRRHPMSLTPRQMETERRAKSVFPDRFDSPGRSACVCVSPCVRLRVRVSARGGEGGRLRF